MLTGQQDTKYNIKLIHSDRSYFLIINIPAKNDLINSHVLFEDSSYKIQVAGDQDINENCEVQEIP